MKTAFLIDGFNLYHSLNDAMKVPNSKSTKWLDLKAFCSSYLPDIDTKATLGPVHYFSALAAYREARDPGHTARHQAYIRCLRDSGVEIELGNFKEKWIDCYKCFKPFTLHEEKESDVAIGVRLLELYWTNQCDAAVIVSADSDLSPAIRTARRHFPKRPIYCIAPWRRGSFDLMNLSRIYFKAKRAKYEAHQFTNPYVCQDRAQVPKPATW